MNKKGLTFVQVMVVLLLVCAGIFVFCSNQPAPQSDVAAGELASFQHRFLPGMGKDADPAEDMTEEETAAYLAELERNKQQLKDLEKLSQQKKAELDKQLEELKKQTESLKQQAQEAPVKTPAAAAPAKKYQGVKVLGKNELTAEELAALEQATGKSERELKKIAASNKRAAIMNYKTNLTDEALAEMEAFSGPKMLIFYADWCPHCRNMKPVFAQLANEYAGRVAVFAFNVDKSPRTYSKYSPRGVPSMVFFKKNHKKHAQTQGEQPASNIRTYLDAIK